MFLGLRTAIYPAPDLAGAKAFWTPLLAKEPYFDEPFYVGYEVAGYELALDPKADPADGVITYWGVADLETSLRQLEAAGGQIRSPLREVGGGIKVAMLDVVGGGILGVIENPHFVLTEPAGGTGPGR